jgi:hypothetical protein
VCLRFGLDDTENLVVTGFNLRTVQSVANRYTDCVIPAAKRDARRINFIVGFTEQIKSSDLLVCFLLQPSNVTAFRCLQDNDNLLACLLTYSKEQSPS